MKRSEAPRLLLISSMRGTRSGHRSYASYLRRFAALATPPEQRVLEHSIVNSNFILVGAIAAGRAAMMGGISSALFFDPKVGVLRGKMQMLHPNRPRPPGPACTCGSASGHCSFRTAVCGICLYPDCHEDVYHKSQSGVTDLLQVQQISYHTLVSSNIMRMGKDEG